MMKLLTHAITIALCIATVWLPMAQAAVPKSKSASVNNALPSQRDGGVHGDTAAGKRTPTKRLSTTKKGVPGGAIQTRRDAEATARAKRREIANAKPHPWSRSPNERRLDEIWSAAYNERHIARDLLASAVGGTLSLAVTFVTGMLYKLTDDSFTQTGMGLVTIGAAISLGIFAVNAYRAYAAQEPAKERTRALTLDLSDNL